MRNYEELFAELQDIKEQVCFVDCWHANIIATENGFRFKDLGFDDYIQTVGCFNEELVHDAFVNSENEPLKVDKAGYYSFAALLSYDDGEADEYGRKYAPAYMMIEVIEFKWLCTEEEMIKSEMDSATVPDWLF